jgi:hypothetical protein
MPCFWDTRVFLLIRHNPVVGDYRIGRYEDVKKENTSVKLSTRKGLVRCDWGRNTLRKVFSMNVGTKFAVCADVMNKNSQILRRPQKLSLGDLILAVSSCTKSSRETVATVADLLGSGRVRVEDHGRFLRAKVC